jgi:hypothetical protein
MKRMLTALVLAGFAFTASAQMGAPNTGINAAMIKLFGDTKAFTAQAQARVLDKELKEVSSIPMTMALLDENLRAEMDLTRAKSSMMPPEAAAMMKQAGMDKMITIVRSDKKLTLLCYPGAQAYAEMPFSENESAESKVETTEIGKDSVDGHPCVKMKLSSTDSKGRPQEAFVWQATDLKKFPIQIQMTQRANTVIVKFEAPKLEKPAASLFNAPDGHTKYPTVQALGQAVMMKMFSGAAPK